MKLNSFFKNAPDIEIQQLSCDSRMPMIDARLARQVAALLEYNKAVRHLRGGEATKRRYQGLQSGTNSV